MNNKIKNKLNKERESFTKEKNYTKLVHGELGESLKSNVDDIFKFDKDIYEQAITLNSGIFNLSKESTPNELISWIKRNKKNDKLFLKLMDGLSNKKTLSVSKLDFFGYYKELAELSLIETYFNIWDIKRKQEIEDLIKKMEQIAKMSRGVQSLSNLFGNFWDLSIHDLYKMDLSQIMRFEDLFANQDFIKRIVDLLGRLASSHNEYEEHLIKEAIFIPSNKKTYYSPENTIGITTGNNISEILPHQLAWRKHKTLNKYFKIAFHEKKLLQLDKRAKMLDEVEVTRKERRLKEDSKGPFILNIDTSGSMYGEPETIAKSMALAIIKIAKKENRDCYIINFSTQTTEINATDFTNDFNKILDFLSHSFSGGTDIGPAIWRSLEKIEEEKYKNADVIFISDIIINSVPTEMERRIEEARKNKVRFHSLTIGNSFHTENVKFLDHNWIYDGSKQSIDKIISDLETGLTKNQKTQE